MARIIDVLIVGQGLAGTTLAWSLLDAGLQVVVLDRGDTVTSSRIAAGLMTPITGKRLAKSWEWEHFWEEARAFYQTLEDRFNERFFSECSILRLFQNAAEVDYFERKHAQFAHLVSTTSPHLDDSLFQAEHGGFEMRGGRLQVEHYLTCSRLAFETRNAYTKHDLQEVPILKESTVSLPELDLSARMILYCQGYQPTMRQEFAPIHFNPAKGEILSVEIPSLAEERILHRGCWIAPQGSATYRVGATYDWEDLTPTTTVAGRTWLTRQLSEFVHLDFQVIDQHAAVRPTMNDFHPVIGFHPEFPQLGMFNGLGSKGALMAPRLARLMTEHLLHGSPLPKSVSLARWYR